jgi:DNA-binding Lrp family transcriptional regulator
LPQLDDTDRQILQKLQQDGKISLQTLAEQLNMSTSPCWRRVKRLQDEGIIKSYVALLDPKALGLNAQAYLQLSLINHKEDTIQAFDRFVQNEPQVIECASITGSKDYLLKVVAEDAEALEQFIMRRVLRLGLISASYTNFVLRSTKSSTALPV